MSEVILTIIHTFILLFTNVVMLTTFIDHMMERNRSLKAWYILSVIKIILINIIFSVILQEQLQTNVQVQRVYLIMSMLILPSGYLMLAYTYNEILTKVMIVATIAEMLVVVAGNLLLIPINIIAGREPMVLYASLHIVDLLYPILTVIMTWILCKILAPIFRYIKNKQIKHSKIWFGIMIVYFMAAIHSNYVSYQQGIFEMQVLVVGVILCVFWGYVRSYHQKVKWEKEYLGKQQRLAKMQYSAIVFQIKKMEQAQKEIQLQMQKILGMPENDRTKQTENYIKGLRRKLNSITQGMYCDSWLLDSVLCHQMVVCGERNVKVDFRLHEYQKGIVREEELAELVHYLLDAVLEDLTVKQISLQIASMKGQLILQLQGDGKKFRISQWRVRRYVKRYQVTFEKKNFDDIKELKLVIS